MNQAWTLGIVRLAILSLLATGCVGKEPVIPSFSQCASPLVLCDDGCVDTSEDAQNCGACDTACDFAKGEVCSGGHCALACDGGTTVCDGSCVDTQTSAAHCGDCDTACDSDGGEVCAAGSCTLACGGGTSACDGACVNTTNDPNHCGDCDTACGDGEVCSASACALSCAGGTSLCGKSCVDFTTDPLHCGGCDTVCATKSGETCQNGSCATACSGGTTRCGDACVDTSVDPSHCGDCDTTCGDHATCSAGTCACADGYSGDGKACTDIDECAGDNDCSPSGECINTDGSYACVCRDDQTGDGKTCTGLELVTLAQSGTASSGLPSAIALSADGRYVAFVSDGQDLAPEVLNNGPELYLRDMAANEIDRVSVDDDGNQADSAIDSVIALSADGTHIGFSTTSDNLGGGGLSACVFVRDLPNATTLLRSGSDVETPAADADEPALSADGSVVAFHTSAELTDTTLAGPVVYLSTGPNADFQLVSANAKGAAPIPDTHCGSDARADAELPNLSADGSRVVFDSIGVGLTSDTDDNCAYDVFLSDLSNPKKPVVTLLSANPDGDACSSKADEAGSMDAVISADGNVVAFDSTCTDLLATPDQLDTSDVFVRDLAKGTLEKVSVSTTGGEGNGDSFTPQISADGRYVAFTSYASNLVSGDKNLVQDVFVRDRMTNKTVRVDLDVNGDEINDGAETFAFSSNGAVVAFLVYQSLLPEDTTGAGQIYLRYLR